MITVTSSDGDSVMFRCPNCDSTDIDAVDLGRERDSDGEFENWRIVCNKCGRYTLDMDSFQDAWMAFNHDDDTVVQPQKEE